MSSDLNALQEFIENDFLVEPNNPDEIKIRLTQILVYYLKHETEKLWSILYRIDVDERKVKALFDKTNLHDIASSMADLIIERQLQKIETRKKYKP